MKTEIKVGILAATSFVFLGVFAYFMGYFSSFTTGKTLIVGYNFAGGIEEGSPIRVMGIKVGRVRKIGFDPNFKMANGEEVKLKIEISVDNRAWDSVRKDSRFFINLAGVIGEKFLEITPGSTSESVFNSGDVVRGEDPPRIDQLISQSYGLAGKILEMVEKNEGSISNTISQLNTLTLNFNKTLELLDRATKNREISKLLDNAIKISDNLAYTTSQIRSEKAERVYDLVYRLLFRLEPLDGPAIKKFFQEEGIKAKVRM